jgi:hypothetical protein
LDPKASSTPTLPSQESELSCNCVLGVYILPLSTILVFAFGIVPTVWVFVFVLNLFYTSHFSLTRVRTGILFILCAFFFQMESNKESILRNWKTIKQYIEPGHFVRELESCIFLPKSSFEKLGSKSQLHQATLVLIKVYRKVQLSEKEYQKFVEILQRNETSRIAADVLIKSVGGPIDNTGTGR